MKSKDGKCSGCRDECLSCDFDTCTACSYPDILWKGGCIKKCPEGYFKQGNTCKECMM